MVAEYQVKKQLEIIIENAYPDSPKLKSLKYFVLKFDDKKVKSYSGTYDLKTRTIRVVDIRGNDGNNITTLLHELSHHVDYVLNGKTGHQAPFYEAFSKLIYSALDLDFVAYEKLKDIDNRNVDYNKVMKILDKYERREPAISLENDKQIINVYNSFTVKESLKGNGYYWNGVSKSWYKEIPENEVEVEIEYIKSLGLSDNDIEITDSNSIQFQYKGKFAEKYEATVQVYNSYDIKDDLKERGYRWNSFDKCWEKGFSENAEAEKDKTALETYKEKSNGTFEVYLK